MADIISTVGTASRNYSTPQAWEDALPASAITAGNNYIAELYKDSEFLAVSPLVIAGCATDATHTLTVRAAAGQSFRDNANVRTNALRYNAANGVSIRGTSGYGTAISSDVGFLTLDGLQIAHTNNGRAFITGNATQPPNVTVTNCLLEAPGSFSQTLWITGPNSLVQNTAVINTGGGTGVLIQASNMRVYGCTVVKVGAASGNGISGTAEVRNTVVANFATNFTGQSAASCSNNASTDATAPGTGSLINLTLASLFEAPGTDYREKTDAPTVNAGTTIGPTTDISGTARPQGTAYDIGAWEVVAASTGGGSTYTLTIANSGQSAVSSTAAITQHHRLTASSTSQSSSTSTAAIVERHRLSVAPSSQAATSQAPAITQRHRLTAANSTQSSTSSTPAMGVLRHTLAVAPSSSSATSSAPAIVQHQRLTVASSSGSASSSAVAITQVLPPRYARPTADVANSGWVPSAGDSLAAMVAEPAADGSTFIQASAPATCRLQLNVVQRPAAGTQQVVRYQVWSATGNGITVRLVHAGTVLASWTHAQLPLDPTVFAQPLNAGQVAAITDWSALALEFEAF